MRLALVSLVAALGLLAVPASAGDVVGAGRFDGKNGYEVSGKAKLVKTSKGHVVRFAKSFETQGGPGLRVWLSKAGPNSGDDKLNDGYIDLGDLKKDSGKQSYKVPKGVKVGKYDSFVVWCTRAVMAFGTAPIR